MFFSDIVEDNWVDSSRSMLPIYQELIEAGFRVWVYRYILLKLLFTVAEGLKK